MTEIPTAAEALRREVAAAYDHLNAVITARFITLRARIERDLAEEVER